VKKLMNSFNQWRFDKKIQLLVSTSIVLTTFLVLIVSTTSTVRFMKVQSTELLQAQNNTIAENFRNSLDNYKKLAIAVVLDTSIQQFLKSDSGNTASYIDNKNNANNTLSSIVNMHSDLNFIAVVDDQSGEYLYKGEQTIYNSNFIQTYSKDYESCKPANSSTMRVSFNNAYYDGNKYSLNVYFPIYDTGNLMGELGLLCMNFTDPSLQQIAENNNSSNLNTVVIDLDGDLLATNEKDKIGSKTNYISNIFEESGHFRKNGMIYFFQKINKWDFYIVSSVSAMYLYHGSITAILFMCTITILMVITNMYIIKKIIQKLYKPLENVVSKMDSVASGSLKTRIDSERMGDDFTKLAEGFNSMMDKIQELMEQVKLEQHQMEQIRFNALQSQIQPHFLYNTLDCIHWQAMADGNTEISTLVKALAKYYRICLSEGHDIISLKQELEHVENYLIIQNMRYDNIIDNKLDIDQNVLDSMIPKLTLQPLVENSIYHGIKVREGKTGTIYIKVQQLSKNIVITLADTGTGMSEEKVAELNSQLSLHDDSFGYGVRNVNKRIQLLYGDNYGLHYYKNTSGGVTVKISFPYRTKDMNTAIRGELDYV